MSKNLYFVLLVIDLVRMCNGIASNRLNPNVSNYPFDKKLYEDVLNPELCQRQLEFLTENNTALLLQFNDASARVPRGILLGNLVDLGNYHQCLKINEGVENMYIQGKYCMTRISISQNIQMTRFPTLEWPDFRNINMLDNEMFDRVKKYKSVERALPSIFGINTLNTRIGPDSPLSLVQTGFAFCIPASCTTREAFNAFYVNTSDTGIGINEDFCRLPNDKPWVAADYVAIVIFSTIGVLVLISTVYDLWHSLILKKDNKEISILYSSFSVYTNSRRLLTFKSGPDSLHCIDGIRALAMVWVVAGHTIMSVAYSINPLDAIQWITSREAVWITAAPITVDTFFMLSGLLVVYTTAGKMSSRQLLKNLPLFYLSRLLRMFPLLAAMILYKTSLHNRVADGPNWNSPASSVLTCRQFWWSALLHIQNWYNPRGMCLAVTWYLSVDVQLHFLSPLVMAWVLTGKRKSAWTALTAGLLASLAAATTYNFVKNFQSGTFSRDFAKIEQYQIYYYTNTLTRASPFFVGMVFGYLLHVWRGKPLQVNKLILLVAWGCSLTLLATVTYCVRLNYEDDWDNQLADNFLNTYMRPAWAVGLGWLIFACVKGHGGPINWFLSLDIWKLPARLSYAMYLIHFTLIISTYSASSVQIYFSVPTLIFDILTFVLITTVIAFVATVTIDAPFATLFKLFLLKDKYVPKVQKETDVKEMSQSRESEQSGMEVEDEEISKKM